MDHEIQERTVKPEDCDQWGCNIGGVKRPAGFKYKVKVKKQRPEEEKGAING